MLVFVLLFFLCYCAGYSYSVPCIPKSGKTAVVIGQDYGSIRNYTTAGFGHNKPFGSMTYLSLRTQAGLKDAVNYGSGTQWVGGLSKLYPDSAIQIGLWIVGDTGSILNGEYDESISNLVQYLNTTESVYYLRIGYEFDSQQNNYPTEKYKKAFQYIVSAFRAAHVTNVAFVWHATGFEPRDGYTHKDWFPGVEYVDWCGVSLFQQPYKVSHMKYADQFATLCKSYELPLMIAESTPFGGILDERTIRENPGAKNRAGYGDSTWSSWFVPVLAFIARHDVRLWSYINCDWDAQPMWAKFHAPGIYWGDSRIEAHRDTLERWKVDVLASNRFIASYDSARSENLCENIPAVGHQTYLLSANFLWQISLLVPILLLFALVDYCCVRKPAVDDADDTFIHH